MVPGPVRAARRQPQLVALLRMVLWPRACCRREACKRTQRSTWCERGSHWSALGARHGPGAEAWPRGHVRTRAQGGGAPLVSQVTVLCRHRSHRYPWVLVRGQGGKGHPPASWFLWKSPKDPCPPSQAVRLGNGFPSRIPRGPRRPLLLCPLSPQACLWFCLPKAGTRVSFILPALPSRC